MNASEKTSGEEPDDFSVHITSFLKASSAIGLVGKDTPCSTDLWSLALFKHFSADLQCPKDQILKVVISGFPKSTIKRHLHLERGQNAL